MLTQILISLAAAFCSPEREARLVDRLQVKPVLAGWILASYDGISCSIMDTVCSDVFSITGKIDSQLFCVLDDAVVAGACEVAGIGPEDPLSDVCAITFAALFETACTAAIDEYGSFGSSQCEIAAGCSSSALAATTTDGLYGLPCSFYTPLIASQFPNDVITTVAECTSGQALAASACLNSGFDAVTAATCNAGLPNVFEAACVTAVDYFGEYTATAVATVVGCPLTSLAAPAKLAATTSTTDGLYGLPCSFYTPLIAKQFPNGEITSVADCTSGQALAASACLNSGFDAVTAATCNAGLPNVFEAACVTAVDYFGEYTATAVSTVVGCPVTSLAVPAKKFAFQ